ncbi:conserved hypothetical protein [Rhodospirillum rubrum ATCC 11170]|nr:conserved hypothetical protein [Rhodospirillum rubrum ATCC 11170]
MASSSHPSPRCGGTVTMVCSPRMRGADQDIGAVAEEARFIPAHAGNRNPKVSPESTRAVHPRACGEQAAGADEGRVDYGSSPRMRGTEIGPGPTAQIDRFIPAHAGNSDHPGIFAHGGAVHPRACGEQTHDSSTRSSHRGSSPRMRGTADNIGSKPVIERFIPAHAGNRPQAV